MKYKHGNSVCISSQAGTRMGCKFCASTYWWIRPKPDTIRDAFPDLLYPERYRRKRVSNVVMMGTGEPMDNYDNVLRF